MEAFKNGQYLVALKEFIILNETNKTDYTLHNNNVDDINDCVFHLLQQVNYEFSYINNSEDRKQLLEWLNEEANKGNSFAQDVLGFIYVNVLYQDKGNRTYLNIGVELLKKSAEQGNTYALNNIGNHYKTSTVYEEQIYALKCYKEGFAKGCKFIKESSIKDLERKINRIEEENKRKEIIRMKEEKIKIKAEIKKMIAKIDETFTKTKTKSDSTTTVSSLKPTASLYGNQKAMNTRFNGKTVTKCK